MNPGPDSLSAVLLSQAVLIPNLIGTFVFAISGGVAGVKGRVDIFGLAVLAFAAGNAGGITRDLLVNETPAVLKSELYAIAALAAGLVVVAGEGLNLPWLLTFTIGSGLCFFLRMMAIHRDWRLPNSRWGGPD